MIINGLSFSNYDLNTTICKIIGYLLITFMIIGSLITTPLLNINKNKFESGHYFLLLMSSVIYSLIFSIFNSYFAMTYLLFASLILFADYLKYIYKLIINDIYTDEVVNIIFITMVFVFAIIYLFSSVNNILFLWFEVMVVILFFVVDTYYLIYLINKILIKLLNTNLIVTFSKNSDNLSKNIKIVVYYIASPILILKKMQSIINQIFYNRSILYYLHSIIAFSSILSFVFVYVLSRHMNVYSQNDIDKYVVLISAIIIPILLSNKKNN